MADFPYMQFGILNPNETLFKTGMDTATGINDIIAQRLKSQFEREAAPIDRQRTMAEAMKAEQEARKTKNINDIIASAFGQSPQGQGGMGMPGGASGLSFGSSNEIGQLLFRRALGLPDETPEEKMRREMEIHRQNAMFNKDLEREVGTSSTLGDIQSRTIGIESVLPILDEILGMDVPSQSGLKVPFIKENDLSLLLNPDKQALYKGKLSAAKESALSAMGLPATSEGLETIERVFGKQPGETDVAYKRRLAEEYNSLISRYIALGGKNKYAKKQIEKAVEGAGKLSKSDGFVKMRAPNGRIVRVPKNKAKEAEQRGATYAE